MLNRPSLDQLQHFVRKKKVNMNIGSKSWQARQGGACKFNEKGVEVLQMKWVDLPITVCERYERGLMYDEVYI